MTVRFDPLTRCPGRHPVTYEPCPALIDTEKFERCSTCRGETHLASNFPRRRYRPDRASKAKRGPS